MATTDAPTLAQLLQLRARYLDDPDGLAAHLRTHYPAYWRRLLACELVADPAARALAQQLATA